MPSYKITITRTDHVKGTERGPYTVIARVPWTDADFKGSASGYQANGGVLEKEPLREIRDYAPSFEVVKPVDTQLLAQTVDELDLVAVIKAINGIQGGTHPSAPRATPPSERVTP